MIELKWKQPGEGMLWVAKLTSAAWQAAGEQLAPLSLSVLQTLGMRQLTFAHKARALQCLLYLADKETIESLFKKPIEEMK